MELYEILCHCWREDTVPQNMRDVNIVTLYKNKGDIVIATTVAAYPFSASWGKLLLESY